MPPRSTERGVCPPDHPHDLRCYVTHKCGDQKCRDVNAAYNRWLKARRKAGILTIGQDVLAIGTRRRVHALNTLGWSTPAIFAYAGLGTRGRDNIAREKVTVRTHVGIRRAYEDLATRRPPETTMPERVSAVRTRKDAERRGYPGPDAWWDTDIDDPNAEPDMAVAPDEPGWIVAELDHMYRLGESPIQASQTLGRSLDTLRKRAHAHGRHDIAAWLTADERLTAA